MEQRTLSAAYKFYCGKNLEDAHTAEADTRATYEVLMSQLDRYPELQNDVAFLADYSSFNKNVDFAGRMVYDDKGVEVFNFGKYKGMSVSDVLKRDPGYYSWILNSDFTLNTKATLERRESGRSAYRRSDCPDADAWYDNRILVTRQKDGQPEFSWLVWNPDLPAA